MKEAEDAYQEALLIRHELAKTNPQAHLPNVATTLNNLAILYHATQRMEEAEKCCCEVERLLEPLWHADPQVYGDLMSPILSMHALLCEMLPGRSGKDACSFAQRAFAAAYHPDIKQATQAMIDKFCTDTYSGSVASRISAARGATRSSPNCPVHRPFSHSRFRLTKGSNLDATEPVKLFKWVTQCNRAVCASIPLRTNRAGGVSLVRLVARWTSATWSCCGARSKRSGLRRWRPGCCWGLWNLHPARSALVLL